MKFGEALKLFPKRNGTGKRHTRKVNATGKVQYASALSVKMFKILKYLIHRNTIGNCRNKLRGLGKGIGCFPFV